MTAADSITHTQPVPSSNAVCPARIVGLSGLSRSSRGCSTPALRTYTAAGTEPCLGVDWGDHFPLTDLPHAMHKPELHGPLSLS